MRATVSSAAVLPPTQVEDATLVAAIIRRQPEALEQLYDRYHTLVYHLALRILQSQENAEEIVEEVFWQVWRDAERYETRRGEVSTWIATMQQALAKLNSCVTRWLVRRASLKCWLHRASRLANWAGPSAELTAKVTSSGTKRKRRGCSTLLACPIHLLTKNIKSGL